jgi:hypothetical protein
MNGIMEWNWMEMGWRWKWNWMNMGKTNKKDENLGKRKENAKLRIVTI